MRNPTLKKAVAELHRFGILQGRRVHGGKESGGSGLAAGKDDRYVIDPRHIFLNFFDTSRLVVD